MIEFPLRVGYCIDEMDLERIAELRSLNSQSLIELSRIERIPCKKCGEQIIVDNAFIKRGYRICPVCQKSIFKSGNTIFQQRISKINFTNIIRMIDQKLKNIFDSSSIKFDKIAFFWLVNDNDKTTIISIYGVSKTTSLFSIGKDEGIVLYLDKDDISPKINNFNKNRFRFFNDPILKNEKDFRDLIKSLDYSNTVKYLEFRKQFEQFINEVNPYFFEGEFSSQFIESIKKNNAQLKTLFSQLQSVKNTIINTKFVNIGGPGQPDFFLIDLFDYLQDALKPEKIGEMKCYPSTKFTIDQFGKAIVHAKSNDTLSIVSTDDIHPFVWVEIVNYRNQDGYYKHVIIDKDLILLLIYNLDLLHLIDIKKIDPKNLKRK
jgi:hypothetical protein